MRVRVRRNFKFADLAKELRPGREAMRGLGEQVAEDIEQRTAAGLDAEGRRFAPGADGEAVDLQASGQMLADLQVVEATDRKVKVGFRTARSERLAALHESGTKRMPARPFVGLSRAMVERVVGAIKRRIAR